MTGFPNKQNLPGGAMPVYIAGPGGALGQSLGFESLGALNTAKALAAIPAGATVAVVSPSAQAVRWRDDGTNPTASVGMPIAVGASQSFSGNLAALKFIEQAASATLNVTYY